MKKSVVLIVVSVIVIALIVACGQIFTVRTVDVIFKNETDIADGGDVIEASGLNVHNNILNIREGQIKDKIAAAYPDNSIFVTNIVRRFPDRVSIYLKERIPIFKIVILPENDEKVKSFVPTDKDFQRNTVIGKESLEAGKYDGLIEVVGYGLSGNTLDTKECRVLRKFALQCVANGINEEALTSFISKINIEYSDAYKIRLCVTLRETNATFSVDEDGVAEDVASFLKTYRNLPFKERYDYQMKSV